MARMTGFVFQDKYLERLAKLSDQEVGRLVRALAKYHASGEEQELTGRECGYYDFIKGDIDEIEDRYAAKCETNRNNRQRPSTTDNDRQRPSTTDNDRAQNKIKEKDINTTTTTRAREDTSVGPVTLDPLILKVQQELNGLTDTHYAALNDYREQLGDDVVSYAVDLAVGNGIRNWSYVEIVLRGWVKAGVKTLGEAKAENERHRQQPQRPQKLLRSQDYHQREYNGSQLEKVLGVDDIYQEGAS